MSYRGEVGYVVAESGRGDGEMSSFEWRIPDFLSLAGEGGDLYKSPSFDACDGEWCLQVYPKGFWPSSPSDWVSLILIRLDEGRPQTLDLTLGIGRANKKERRQEVSSYDHACFWGRFCLRSQLRKQNSRLMPGKALILRLDMKRVVPRDSSTQTVEEAKEDEVPTGEKQGGEKALEDFGALLDSGERSDVTVQVGDVAFKVHSPILLARSPALSVSLRHASREKASGKILVEDTEPGAFGAYLQHLYTGSVRSLAEQNVFDLYRLADRYLADDLRSRCLEHVLNTLSVGTFCDAVRLALTHGEGELLERALGFARENIQSSGRITSAIIRGKRTKY